MCSHDTFGLGHLTRTLRHRVDKDASPGDPRFRPETYAGVEAELAFTRDWSIFETSVYGTYDLRDENRWFNERDRRGLGIGGELGWSAGASTQLRPYYEFEVTRSRNEPDLGSDLSHREHAFGFRWVQDLQLLGAAWKVETQSKWKFRTYTTDDPTDTSRYDRRDRTFYRNFYGSARLLWARKLWSPFVSGSIYRRIAGNANNEADDTESDKVNLHLGVAFAFE